MNPKFDSFEVKGGYTHGGVVGTFEGDFRISADGKLVGLMYDEGKDICLSQGQSKLVLGLSGQDGRVNFWKLAKDTRLMPLVYSLGQVDVNQYNGVWAPIEGLNAFDIANGVSGNNPMLEIIEAFETESEVAKLDALSRIKTSTIHSYLNPLMIDKIMRMNLNDGFLELIKKE